MKSKDSIIFYESFFEATEELPDATIARLWRACRDYMRGEEPNFDGDPAARLAWKFIVLQLNADAKKWEETRNIRSDVGKLGAQKRWQGADGKNSKSHPKMANDSKGIFDIANDGKNSKSHFGMAKMAVTVTDDVTVNDYPPYCPPLGGYGENFFELKKAVEGSNSGAPTRAEMLAWGAITPQPTAEDVGVMLAFYRAPKAATYDAATWKRKGTFANLAADWTAQLSLARAYADAHRPPPPPPPAPDGWHETMLRLYPSADPSTTWEHLRKHLPDVAEKIKASCSETPNRCHQPTAAEILANLNTNTETENATQTKK